MNIDARQIAPTDRAQWLRLLRAGDVVLVRNGRLHFRSCIDRATATLLLIGSLKFRRTDGTLIRRRGARLSVRSYARFQLAQEVA